MPRWKVLVPLLLACVIAGHAWAQAVLPREVRERILQAVVEVRPYDMAGNRFAGTSGSGTIVSPDGFVLTNFHVVGDDDTGRAYEWHGIFVTDPRSPDLEPEFRYWARFVAGDPRHDLAVVHIVEDAEERPLPAGFAFVSMPVGDSNSLIPGDPITVVGYPGISGSTITFTSGIVSGFLGEDLTAGGKQWIKTDAKLARGNSGGAAFDENGLLVGIPTLRVQTTDESYIEQQDYLRPISLAWPLLTAHVANVNRAGGLGSQVASAAPTPANPLAPASVVPTPATPTPAPVIPTPTPIVPVGFGLLLSERGALGPDNETLDSGEYLAFHEVELTAGAPVAIGLSSAAFDVYLAVLDPSDQIVLEVDDSPGHGSDVAESFVPAASGRFTLVVTSYAPGETGDYLLEVAAASEAVGPTAPSALAGDLLLSERGVLGAAGFTLDGGEYVDVYTVTLAAGVPVWFELSSDAFDVYLVVLGPNDDIVLEVDDSAGYGLDVATSLVPPASGEYLVAVTSAFAGESGAYTLTARVGEVGPNAGIVGGGTPPAVGSASGLVGSVAIGEQVRAELAGAVGAAAFHTYFVDVPAGAATLVVEMAADADLDLFLKYGSEIVSLGDDGDWDYRDVDPANRALLTVPAPRAGRWFVDVVWLDGGPSTARYALRVR
ncbi:MAG: trypsin-like peptidase domain-containing protein [Trueperaceae bacterium]|nr:trypsin-like peptidase domain-containing protein [Trueperaceae bacterium]